MDGHATQLRRRLRGIPSQDVDVDINAILQYTGQILPEHAFGRRELLQYAKTSLPVKVSEYGALHSYVIV